MQVASFPFGKEVQRYQQSEVTTPYQKLGQKYDKPIGDAVYKAYVWRVVFFSASGLGFLLSLILIAYLNALPARIVVEQVTDKVFLKSPPVLLSPNYHISSDVLENFIRQLVVGVQKDKGYNDFIRPESLSMLKQNLAALGFDQSVHMNFNQFEMAGDNFTGELANAEGETILVINGKFRYQPLATQQEVKLNPLGIYVEKLSVQRL